MTKVITGAHLKQMLELAQEFAESLYVKRGKVPPMLLVSRISEADSKPVFPTLLPIPAEFCSDPAKFAAHMVPLMLEAPDFDIIAFVSETWVVDRTHGAPPSKEQVKADKHAAGRREIHQHPDRIERLMVAIYTKMNTRIAQSDMHRKPNRMTHHGFMDEEHPEMKVDGRLVFNEEGTRQ